jgi:hypothetical protein
VNHWFVGQCDGDENDGYCRPRRLTLVEVAGTGLGTHGTTFERFVEHAVAIIDERGIDALVMREIAARSHYSVSTVSYHVTPWSTFLTHVWASVRADMVAVVLPPPPVDEAWCHTAADRVMAWAGEHPALAYFLVSHFPQPEVHLTRPREIDAIRRDLGLGDRSLGRVAVQMVIRQVQSLVEMAVNVGGEEGARLLGAQLHHQLSVWQAVTEQLADAGGSAADASVS